MADTYKDEHNAIKNHFVTQWGGVASLETDIAFDVLEFEAREGQPWVRLNILNGEARQASIGDPGNNLHRYAGSVMLQVFSPAGDGAGAIVEIMDRAVDAFNNVRLDNIKFWVANATLLPVEGPWARGVVTCPFQRDTRR